MVFASTTTDTSYTSSLCRQYSSNTDLYACIRIENGTVTLTINDVSYTSFTINDLRYVGIINWNNAKTVTYTDFIVETL